MKGDRHERGNFTISLEITTMNGRIRTSMLLAFICSVLALPANVGATPAVTGDGTFTVTANEVINAREADGNTILTLHVESRLTGILDGTTVAEETAVVHPNGLITVEAFETFTGTANGVAGTAVFRTVGTANAATGEISGELSVVSGTGDLANLRGRATFQGVGDSGIYTAKLHFDPKA